MVSLFKKDSLETDEAYLNHIMNFVKFAAKLLKIGQDFKIYLLGKGQDNGSTTGGYNPSENTISVLYEGRSLIDILRSIAHEIEHQRQNALKLMSSNEPVQNIGGFLENDANIIAGILIKLYVKLIDDHNIYWM